MKKVYQIELDTGAEQAWTIVGEGFGETGKWTSLLDSSLLVGDLTAGGSRVCKQGNNTLIEKITSYDPANMTLTYELTKGRPFIIQSASNTWTVTPYDPYRCIVKMSPDIGLKWWAIGLAPVVSFGIGRALRKVLKELKVWAETGVAHPRKQKQKAKTRIPGPSGLA